MWRRLEQLRALAPWERRMLARVVLVLPVVGAALHVVGFKRTRDLLEWSALSRPASVPLAAGQTSCAAHGLARLVSIAAHHGPYRATCLRQSLALWWLLRRHGIPGELRIGVRKDGGRLRAHAWVEYLGISLGREDLSYAPFLDLHSPAQKPLPNGIVRLSG